MTREQIDERISLCDEYLTNYRADDDPPAVDLAAIGIIGAGATPGHLIRLAVEQRRREFVFMRELRDKWFL